MFPSVQDLSEKFDRSLAKIFVLIGLPTVLFFVFFVPPFQVPDEYAQLLRADQISYGTMVGTRLDGTESGGYAASSYRLLAEIFPVQPAQTGSATARLAAASAVPLTNKREFFNFPNTVQYGPIAYAPQAAALALARVSGMSALVSFYLARLFSGVTALLVGFLALQTAGRGRYLIFSLLTMPTTLFFMGSLSQDGLLLTGAALFLSIVSNIVSKGRIPNLATHITLIALLVSLAWGRLPYVVLCVVFLLTPLHGMEWRGKIFRRWPGLIAISLVICLSVFWAQIVSTVQIDWVPFTSVREQTRFLLTHVYLIPQIAVNSLHGPNFFFAVGGIFGSLGVYNSKLPLFFYVTALISVVSAVILDAAEADILKSQERAMTGLALLIGVGAVYLALYLTFTPVGQLAVLGIQGRYLIPFIFGLAFVLPAASVHLRKSIRPLVLLLPLIALMNVAFSIDKIITRYY